MSEINVNFQEIQFKHGTIGEEIQRLMRSRTVVNGKIDRESNAAPMLSGFVISFVHFVLMLIVFGPGWEEIPDIEDVWQVLNGNDLLRHMGLLNALGRFLPVLFDTEIDDSFEWIEAEKITDLYNQWVKKETAQS